MRDQVNLKNDIESAQRLVAEIWSLKLLSTGKHHAADKVVLSRRQHQLLRLYYAFLGDLEKPAVDYIGNHQIFGLDYCVDFDGQEINLPRVE